MGWRGAAADMEVFKALMLNAKANLGNGDGGGRAKEAMGGKGRRGRIFKRCVPNAKAKPI